MRFCHFLWENVENRGRKVRKNVEFGSYFVDNLKYRSFFDELLVGKDAISKNSG